MKRSITSILIGAVVALVGFAGMGSLMGDQSRAVSNGRDCTGSAIITCGVTSQTDLINKYNASSSVQRVFSDFAGIDATTVRSGKAVSGYVSPSGVVYANGKAVAKNASTISNWRRLDGTSKPITIAGKTYHTHSVFEENVSVYVWLNEKGQFIGAVILGCGNAVKAVNTVPEPPKPVYSCDSLQMTKISRTKFQFYTNATAKDGATSYRYLYDFGDGTTASGNSLVTHTYAKAGTYTVKATFQVMVNGKVYNAPGNCTVTVTVTPEVCPIPGKEQYPKDSPECREDKPAVTISKTVNKVEHVKVKVGTSFTYEIVVKNTGNVALKNAVVTDKAPKEVTLVSGNVGTVSGNTWTYTIPELKVGESKSFTLTAKYATYASGAHKNTVCVDTPTIPGGPDDCDDATTETHEPIKVCDTTTDTIVVIERSQLDESKHTTDLTKCEKIKVCVMEEKAIREISKNDFDTAKHTTDYTKCETVPVVPETPDTPVIELPETGLTDIFGGSLGLGTIVGAAHYYRASRRAIL